MSKRVPFKILYDNIETITKIGSGLLNTTAGIYLLLLILEKFQLSDYVHLLNIIVAIFSFAYFLIAIFQHCVFFVAENNRILDFIDNSLGTKLSEVKSVGYFSNDNVEAGIIKMGINCFENSYFTYKIAMEMLKWLAIKSTIILALFIIVAAIGQSSTFIMLLKLSLPFSVIQSTIRVFTIEHYTKRVFENFMQIFQYNADKKLDALIINNVLAYEKTLSWANIKLSDKIFQDLNNQLSSEWESIKADIFDHT